jgi:hypothetical protein
VENETAVAKSQAAFPRGRQPPPRSGVPAPEPGRFHEEPTMTTKTLPCLTLAIAVALGGTLLAASADASARERGARAERQAPRGDYTRHTERTRTDTGHVRRDTWTGANGRTATRDATVVNDRESRTRTRDATTTLPDGRTRSMNDVVTRKDSGYGRDTTITNPNGSTLQRDVTAARDASTGTWTRDISVDRTPAPKPGG